MLSSVTYITENYNDQYWSLEDNTGFDFEDYLHGVFSTLLKPYYKSGLRITHTSKTRDDGIDIYISSPIEFSLMGINFSLNGKKTINTVIECKSTKRDKISLDKFARNIIDSNEWNIDYFVLATNGTIVPSAYYKSITEFEKNGCKFLLFDQYFLLQFLDNSSFNLLGKVEFTRKPDSLQIQYQLRKGRVSGRNCFELFLDARNYSNKPTNIIINLISNRNWSIDDTINSKHIPPHQGICIKLIVKRIYNDGIDDFKINLSYDNQIKVISIKNPEVVPDFQPPLAGREHKKLINDIYNELLDLDSFQLFYLYGNAGVGKTRIIDEICKRVIDTDYSMIHILCNKKQRSSLTQLLAKELNVTDGSSDCYSKVVDKLHESFSRHLIIIEDLHNADDAFYKQIKTISKDLNNDASSFILAGRDDDTVFNEAFFSFSTWLKEKALPFQVKNFGETDCRAFIKSIVKDIPSMPLDRLVTVSLGNPFYIVQFIEYLLEIDFATLLNRNTVGMTNISSFSSKKYIPSKIEDLIKDRKKQLVRNKNGYKYVEFLRILTLFGICIPKHIIDEYWGNENESLVQPLFKKHYLSYDDTGNIRFDHETIFLYYNHELEDHNLKSICKTLVKNYTGILHSLPDFQRAKVLYYAGEFEKSSALFSPIIKEFESFTNVSSTNLFSEYFDYTDEIYSLAQISNKTELQEKIIKASVYISMHTRDYGTTIRTIEDSLDKIDKNHPNNSQLKNTVLQLRAHTELTAAKLKQAEQFFLDLIASERLSPENFSEESRFDLFDRTASLYTRYNFMELAKKYNSLASKTALLLDDPKLISLATMMKAKIYFYNNPQKSLNYMLAAKEIMKKDRAYRINCHNNTSIIGADLLIDSEKDGINVNIYIKRLKKLLTEAVDNNYSFTIIRCNLLLATLYYLRGTDNSIRIAKKYIDDGINASVRYGCEKLMNYYYNLKAVISIKEGFPPEETLKFFDTMLDYLAKQNLLFLGALDFCYGNVVSLTNYAMFIYQYGDEQRLYRFLSSISYYQSNQSCDFHCSETKHCYYSCSNNISVFKENIKRIEKGKLILIDTKYHYPFCDPNTGYYLVIH